MFSSSTSEERFRERMRRRTSRVVEDLEKQNEARRIGHHVADQVLRAIVVGYTSTSTGINASNNSRGSIYHSFNYKSYGDSGGGGASSIRQRRGGSGRGLSWRAAAADDLMYSSKSVIPSYNNLLSTMDEVSSDNGSLNNSSTGGSKGGFAGSSVDEHDIGLEEVDIDDDEFTSERAVRRGTRRGFRESNESGDSRIGGGFGGGDDDEDTNSEVDLTTITDAFTDFTTKASRKNELVAKKEEEDKKKKNKKLKWGKKWRLSTVKEDDDRSDNGELIEEVEDEEDGVWMCGVCGRMFHSLETAERHEDNHLRQVIHYLGWGEENPNNMAFLSAQQPPDDAFSDCASPWNNYTNNNHDNLRPARRRTRDSGASGESSSTLIQRSSPRRGGRRPVLDSLHDTTEEEAKVELERSRSSFPLPPTLMMGGSHDTHNKNNYKLPPPIDTRQISAGRYGSQLTEDALIPKSRHQTLSSLEMTSQYDPDITDYGYSQQDSLLMNESMLNYVVLADEALLNVCLRATPLILTPAEVQAERNLSFLAKDKHYYQEMTARALARRTNPSNRFRSDDDTLKGHLQNKILDAYQLMKEGDKSVGKDQYNKKQVGNDVTDATDMSHTKATLYVNVLVRNSVQVVKHELERLAGEKWEAVNEDVAEKYTRFERFRAYAHVNIVKLASLALASDFTPRRIAIQLSNDLYRLLTPKLKRRGVTIGTEIEYRVGGYFVIAVNINTIDWTRLVKTSNKDRRARTSKWKKEMKHGDDDDAEKHAGRWHFFALIINFFRRLLKMDKYVILDTVLAWLYNLHWIIYLPICKIAYRTPRLGYTIRKFIISSAIDEIFLYVHEKGMEMEIRVCYAHNQASFMLSALREIRADGREFKKKRQETEAHEVGTILGPLLGHAIKADKGPAVAPPGFEIPPNLEYVGLELDLPVGFRRLRWAYLSSKSSFITNAFWKAESKYEDITVGEWSKHADFIGDPNPPPTVNTDDFVGAEYDSSYLMPKSAFVSANMCYTTSQIIAYNDYCFCLKSQSKNPDIPFGGTFIAWTQIVVINTGNDSCKMICSVEAEFPNGPPMVARQIQSGMRAGTGDSFVLIGETITKYANAFP